MEGRGKEEMERGTMKEWRRGERGREGRKGKIDGWREEKKRTEK